MGEPPKEKTKAELKAEEKTALAGLNKLGKVSDVGQRARDDFEADQAELNGQSARQAVIAARGGDTALDAIREAEPELVAQVEADHGADAEAV